ASGSGKSSLLRAGVIPALRDGAVPGVASRPVHLMTPGHEPLAQLQALLDGDSGQPGHPGGLVVVVDQLEELFAPSVSHEEREAFVARLATLAAPLSGGTAGTVGAASGTAGRAGGAAGRAGHTASPDGTAGRGGGLVLLGLRADYYGRALAHPPLARALQDAQVVVTPMTEPELRRAITEPARLARVEIEDGLVDLVLSDMGPVAGQARGHEAGALPLLSHALLATWEHGNQRRLTIAGYRATGGLRGAVAQTAETVYASLPEEQRHLARDLMLRLVRVSADGPD